MFGSILVQRRREASCRPSAIRFINVCSSVTFSVALCFIVVTDALSGWAKRIIMCSVDTCGLDKPTEPLWLYLDLDLT